MTKFEPASLATGPSTAEKKSWWETWWEWNGGSNLTLHLLYLTLYFPNTMALNHPWPCFPLKNDFNSRIEFLRETSKNSKYLYSVISPGIFTLVSVQGVKTLESPSMKS